MASVSNQLSFFFLLMLFLSPQIQAREGKFFSLFTHFKTIYNVKDHDKAESPAPTPAPFAAPTPAPVTAPTQEPAAAPEFGSTIPSGPAPEPEFFDKGEGYGLYGSDSSQYSSTEDTPTTTTTTTTTFENKLLNEDFNDKTYKTGYPQTNFHNNELYTKNYNSEEYKNNYNNEVYTKNYNSEEYKTNYNNGKEYYNNNNNNNNYYGNGYERKGEGMSDTRLMENGKYYYNVNSENENYNLNGYEAGRGSTENEGYYEKNKYPNEFDTMEEYEKQQEAQGYTP